ncbi:MAG: hypothetical protein V7L25_21465 [Nostoc sp.]
MNLFLILSLLGRYEGDTSIKKGAINPPLYILRVLMRSHDGGYDLQ